MLKTKPQTKNTPNMSARWRKDKYVLCIHKLEIYTVMKKNESDQILISQQPVALSPDLARIEGYKSSVSVMLLPISGRHLGGSIPIYGRKMWREWCALLLRLFSFSCPIGSGFG